MVAYYYYNESFDGRTECSEWDIYESSDSRIDNSTDDSTPLFYKIFSSFKK